MRESWQNKDSMLPSADSLELAESSGKIHENHSSAPFDSKQKEQNKQTHIHNVISKSEHRQADLDLNSDLARLDDIFGEEELLNEDTESGESLFTEVSNDISFEDHVKALNSQLKTEGKSNSEILNTLLSTFSKEESLTTWVENWKNFQRLHAFAKSKPPKEQRVIEGIISGVDFTSKDSFSQALVQIEENQEISAKTKREIAVKFGKSEVSSVKQMDGQLKKLKKENQRVVAQIGETESNQTKLSSRLKELDKKLESSSLGSIEMEELEQEKKELKTKLKASQKKLKDLKEKEKSEIGFPLRKGFKAVLEQKGKRFVSALDGTMKVQLPSNRLPFTHMSNLESVNFAFVQNVMSKLGLAKHLMKPPFENGNVPSGELRKFSRRVLEALGFNTGSIITQEEISTLESDLSFLGKVYPVKDSYESLKELGIIEIEKGLNPESLFEALQVLEENRNTETSLKISRLRDFRN